MKEQQHHNEGTQGVAVKPYSTKELSALYEVDRKTLQRWLAPFEEQIGKRMGYYYNARQVKIIFSCLGTPEKG